MSTEVDYGARCNQLTKSLKEFSGAMDKIRPDIDVYVLGSLGRRLAVAALANGKENDIYLEDYFKIANRILRPRLNEKSNWDVDVAVPEDKISWNNLRNIARWVTTNNPGIEIDPHLLVRSGEKGFIPCDKNRKVLGNEICFKELNIKVDEHTTYKTMDLYTLLEYFFTIGKLRSKDLSEIAFLISAIQLFPEYKDDGRKNEVITKAERYVFSKMMIKDTVKMFYHHMPMGLQKEIGRIRHKEVWDPSKNHNFDLRESVYF